MPNSNPACKNGTGGCDPANTEYWANLYPSITLYGSIVGRDGYYGDELTLNNSAEEWFDTPNFSWWSISCRDGVWRLHWDGTASGGGSVDATGGTFPNLTFPGYTTS
ncbi:hypothetical protein V6x_54260 [Gimesia chilikensis]|uniref:Uncharacterized protein n=1 Tax=Gimesia chilikensis TaxID=2605989 RepID=A0A517WK98_9PLAN|nr:hypothetical protein [Gimesia chilikensis]QDU05685.1 hypothetical protein V6x_54260 [Gimesia chilikensis]